jgi:membrane peptidoglycan carboxypeptidase
MKLAIKRVVKIIFYTFLAIVFLGLAFFVALEFDLLGFLSSEKFDKNKLTIDNAIVEMYDNNNSLVKIDLKEQKKIDFDELNSQTIDAFISIEDKNFYTHKGVNYKRMIKSTLKNLSKMKFVEGASTISQQLIKNTHLTSEKTIKRKLSELILTKKMEKVLTKKEIMTAYLNAIYFGNGTFGINQASQRYFSKSAKELNLAESATLAGMIKSPKLYSPTLNPENCIKRRNLVLNQMYLQGKIDKNSFEQAINTDLNLNQNKSFLGYNTYYNYAIDEACNLLNMSEKDLIIKGYKLVTFLDSKKQETIVNQIENEKLNNMDCLVVSLDNKSGGVSALYGKSDFNLSNVYRQPGSIFKPIISYAPALEKNIISPLTPILDEKIDFDGYSPNNFTKKFYGWVSCKNALAKSLNIPSVKLLNYVGIDNAKKFASQMIELDKNDNGFSLALGGLTKGVKIIDIANCYQAIANNGKKINARFIKYIKDKNGREIFCNFEREQQVMKESTAYLLTDMLKESVANGTCRKLSGLGLDIASKTGTVGDSKKIGNSDAWNVSFTPKQTLCVWVGATSDEPLPNSITGSNLPTKIAQGIYCNIEKDNQKFCPPPTVQEIEISQLDLAQNNVILLAPPYMPDRYKTKSLFASDNIPQEFSKRFDKIDNFTLNGKLNNGVIELSLDAQKHLVYDIFRQNDDEMTTIATISNKQGVVTIQDVDVEKDNFYTYYAKASLLCDDTNLSTKSSYVKFYIE